MGQEYAITVRTQLNTKLAEAQIKALGKDRVVKLDVKLNAGDTDTLKAKISEIGKVATELSRIKIFSDEQGNVNRAVVQYTDLLGKAVTETIMIAEEVVATKVYTQDLAKEQRTINQLTEQQQKMRAREADEMNRMVVSAEKFLEKAKNMSQSGGVVRTSDLAKQLTSLGNLYKNAFGSGDYKAAEQYAESIRKINDQFQISKEGLKANKSGLDSWSVGLKNAIKQSLEYVTSLGLIYGAMNQLKQGVQYISDLDKEMTNIQIATGLNDEQVSVLAEDYNNLSKELGITTIAVAKGATTWLKQGKTVEETGKLIRNTAMLAKLAMLDEAEASEYLTAILNGYKKEVDDASDVVSKLVAVDNASATSVNELSVAISRSANIARLSGVDFENLTAYIGTVSSVTRRSAESVGEAFNLSIRTIDKMEAL